MGKVVFKNDRRVYYNRRFAPSIKGLLFMMIND